MWRTWCSLFTIYLYPADGRLRTGTLSHVHQQQVSSFHYRAFPRKRPTHRAGHAVCVIGLKKIREWLDLVRQQDLHKWLLFIANALCFVVFFFFCSA